MWRTIQGTFKKSRVAQLTLILFVALTLWWITIFMRGVRDVFESNLFSAIYFVIALIGGLAGIGAARRWDGRSSVLGRAVFALAAGMLAQVFGQLSYAVGINVYHFTIPYPSVGDIGYFGSVFFYIYGVVLLARATGIRFSLKKYRGQLQVILIPALLLTLSYIVFLRGYVFDWSHPLRILLDFGYPLGEATYVSIALLALLLSRNILGGTLRSPLVLLLVALIAQYLSDYVFLYQAYHGTWLSGGINDYMYLISYFLMTIGLIQIGVTARRLTQN